MSVETVNKNLKNSSPEHDTPTATAKAQKTRTLLKRRVYVGFCSVDIFGYLNSDKEAE